MDGVIFSHFLGTPVWMWAAFVGLVGFLLALDLGVLSRGRQEIGAAQSLKLAGFYFVLAMAFGGWIWFERGAESGMAYLTGFFVEWSLSLDNVFAISMIFTYFAVPRKFQHRVLFWGIVGVVVMRGVMIAAGAALVAQFQWTLYVFGAFLFATGVKMLLMADQEGSLAGNPVLGFLNKHIRVTDEIDGERFFVRRPDPVTGRPVNWATPLFLCLVLVEAVDMVFAVDSVPAIFAITTDPYLVYTSNIFAILGLRSLYFALAAMIHRFRYLKYALAAILLLVGTKIFLVGFGVKVPAALSLSATAGLIAAGIGYSLWRTSGTPQVTPAAASSGRSP
ncbi:MAG: TerC/Alx family metal homeostasis membrane protein [Alphaproteobacteria bacterium]|nr:TerC/Alx family metal homeostasis membrane protein [Alphaproteobacteria bacterium]